MPTEKDLRDALRLQAEQAARTSPDFTAAFDRQRPTVAAGNHRTWIAAGVAAAVVTVAVGVPVAINATSGSSSNVAPAATRSSGSSGSGAPATSATASSGAISKIAAATRSTTATSTAAGTSAPVKSTMSSSRTSAQPATSTRATGPAASKAAVTTLPAGTDRMRLREANGVALCTGSIDTFPESVVGPFAVTDTNFVLDHSSGLTADEAMSSPTVVRIRVGGLPIRNAHIQLTTIAKLTVPADAVKLTVNGLPAYYAKLCGAGTLAWQWQPGSWATVVGNDSLTKQLTQAMAERVVGALKPSHASVPVLPFTVGIRPEAARLASLVRVGAASTNLEDIVAGTEPPTGDGTRIWTMAAEYVTPTGQSMSIVALVDDTAYRSGTKVTINGHDAYLNDYSLNIQVNGYVVVVQATDLNNKQWLTNDTLISIGKSMTFAPSFKDHSGWFPADTGLK